MVWTYCLQLVPLICMASNSLMIQNLLTHILLSSLEKTACTWAMVGIKIEDFSKIEKFIITLTSLLAIMILIYT